jgi:hypothetical protein
MHVQNTWVTARALRTAAVDRRPRPTAAASTVGAQRAQPGAPRGELLRLRPHVRHRPRTARPASAWTTARPTKPVAPATHATAPLGVTSDSFASAGRQLRRAAARPPRGS